MAMLDCKLRPWEVVQDHMTTITKTTDPQEDSLIVPYGLQLAHTMHHPHVVRCLAFYHTTAGDTYVTHIDKGYTNEVYVWTISSLNETEMQCVKFPIKSSVSKLIFVAQHRVFVGFCTDLTLHVFSDYIHHCADLTQTSCPATILCLTYIDDTDELITGGHGCLQAWKMTHAELREPLTPGRPIDCQITCNDWVRIMSVDRKQRQLVALCDEGVFIIDYVTNKQKMFIRNWHQTALTSCVFYRRLEYFITASMDGAIKVWNGVVFSQVHEFIGHYDCVTGLATHPTDPLLLSSSKDGTIRVWRLDTFELTQRLDVGEKILGMRLTNSNQIFYNTLHDIKIWNFNLFHHIFTPIQSCVHKLARVKSPTTPSRILCAAEDGGVRLISAVTGAILTIIYPMASYQVLTDIVYDPTTESIYTTLSTGDVLVFNTSSNPCQAMHLWVPEAEPDDCVLCMALVKLDCAHGRQETAYSQTLIFAGHNSGQITLLEASRYFMKDPKQAHCGLVTGLEISHGWYQTGSRKIGGADRLISSGSDKGVRVWAIEISSTNSAELVLVCLKTIVCDLGPTHISMLGNVLCMVLPSKTVHMYQLLEDPYRKRRTSVGMGSNMGSSTTGYSKLYTHLKDHDHTQKITGLCSCPSMRLFATTSGDGSVKIWDLTNTLVRELCFDNTLRSVCFANERGDLVVGFQNHISYVSITSYLPLSIMEEAINMDFKDEEKEEPVKFNPDLKLWFDLDTLPTYPAELVHRRQIQESVRTISKYSMRYKASLGDQLESLREEGPCSSTSSSDEGIDSSLESDTSERELAIFTPAEIKTRPATVAMEDASKIDEDVDSGRGESPVLADTDEKTGDVKAEEESPKEEEEEEEKKTKRWPIAPDGYIPNSVIRAIIGYKPPPTPPTSPWKLKAVPEGGIASPSRRSLAGSDASYENHEPFSWASSEDDEDTLQQSIYSLEGRLSTIPGSVTPSRGEESEERKKSRGFGHLPTPGKIEIPDWEQKDTGKKGKKNKRRKSRMINASELQSLKRHLPKEVDIEDKVEEEEPADENIPALLKRIAKEEWFPKRVILNVENVTLALMDLLNGIPDLQYRFVCEALVEINKELEMEQKLADSVVSKMMLQLTRNKAVARANAIKTLANFGLCRKSIILSLLRPMADDDDDVRQEAMNAVARLAGIKSRTGLVNYLDSIGLLPQYHAQERDVIEELKERYTSSPIHRPLIRHSIIGLLGNKHHQLQQMRRNQEEEEDGEVDVERLFPSDDELPVASPTELISSWFSENSIGSGKMPPPGEEELYPRIKTKKELRQEQMRAKHQRKVSQRPDRPRRHPGRPSTQEETLNDGDIYENLDGLTAEEGLDEFEEKRLSFGSIGQMSERSLESGSNGHLGSFDSSSTMLSQRRRTIHVEMMDVRMAMLAKEKDFLVDKMKDKLRKHRERYSQMMEQKRRQAKSIMPNKPNFFKYYAQREKLEAKDDETSTESSSFEDMTSSSDQISTDLVKESTKIMSTLERVQSESGLGESSCLFTDTDTKTGGALSSSGFITDQESLTHDTSTTRPKSSLTVENVQRLEAKSAKGKKKKKTKQVTKQKEKKKMKDVKKQNGDVMSKKKQKEDVQSKKKMKPPDNWRKLYLEPLMRPHHDNKMNKKRAFPPIRCIRSDVKLVTGDPDERLLHSVAFGSIECQDDKHLIAKDKDFGISQYGKLQFTWTTQTPMEEVNVEDAGDQCKIPVAPGKWDQGKIPGVSSMGTDQTDKSYHKMWLQQHLLFPSLCKLRTLDENKRQNAIMRRLHLSGSNHTAGKDDAVYKWESPEPYLSPVPPSNVDRLIEVKKSRQWKQYSHNDKRSPMGSYHLPYLTLNLPAPEPPIVPRNSTVSHHETLLLPKLLNSEAPSLEDDMQSLSEEASVH